MESTRKRIKEATNVDVTPIYYAAGYKDGNQEQNPWNLSKLLVNILQHTKSEKRAVFMQDINKDAEMWKDDDKLQDYQQEIKKSFFDSVKEVVGEVVEKVAEKVVEVVVEKLLGAISKPLSRLRNFFQR